jgi:hypothetical protein
MGALELKPRRSAPGFTPQSGVATVGCTLNPEDPKGAMHPQPPQLFVSTHVIGMWECLGAVVPALCAGLRGAKWRGDMSAHSQL